MSNKTQIAGFIGAVVGAYFTAGTSLAAYGGAIGGLVGGAIGASLEDDTYAYGPRMDDNRVQVSTYGASVPYLFGTTRVAGNVIWANDIEEVATENEQGKGGPSNTQITYTYFGTFAVLLGYGPVRGVRRIWGDSVLIFDGTTAGAPSPDFGITFYNGTETQMPDPTIEAALGAGNVPAYRGYGYMVLNRLPLEKFGNRLPSITVELVGEGEWESTPSDTGSASAMDYTAAVQRLDGYVVAIGETVPDTTMRLEVIDPTTGAVIATADHAMDLHTSSMFYVPPTNELWVSRSGFIERFNADTLAHVGTVTLVEDWSACVGAYEPQRRRVIAHRSSSQVGSVTITAIGLEGYELPTYTVIPPSGGGEGGEVVVSYGTPGLFFGAQVATGGNAVFLVCGGLEGFGVFEVGSGNETPLITTFDVSSGARGVWDDMHQRYVVVSSGGTLWTVSDANPPTITAVSPAGYSGNSPSHLQYIAGLNAIVIWSRVASAVSLTVLDASTFEVLHVHNLFSFNGIVRSFASPDDPGRVFNIGGDQPYDVQLYATTVGATVSRLALASDLTPADIDVSELTQRLRGYLVSQAGPARGAVEQLAMDFHFQGVEEDDVVYFRRRGGAVVATVTEAECGAGIDAPSPQPITTTRAQEMNLPARLSVTAPDPTTDHQPGTQYAERRAIEAGQEEGIRTAVVMTATEARRLADALIFDRWASRESIRWATTRKHARLSPSDPITLAGRRVRIMSRSDEGGVINWEGVTDDADVVNQTTTGVQGSFPGQVTTVQVPTLMVILDMALLADAQNDAGAYVAAWGIAPYWRGAVIYGSADGGAGWTRVATMPRPGSAVGMTTTALGDWTGGNVFDEINSVNLSLSNGTMSSTTRAGVLAGNNAIAIQGADGWEVLQYRNAVLEADGTYTLSGLLRGRRGTGFATGGHAAGRRAVLLTSTNLRDLTITNSQIGVSQLYKPVSIGDTLSATASEPVTINAERLKPWAPVDLRAARDIATGDITFAWKRRTRLACRFTGTGGINVPLGEDSEAYVVQVMDSGSFSTVIRTIDVTGPASATYSAADQTTDFGSPQSTVYVRISQTSATVGAGHLLEAAA